ncbi:MAG: DUF3566 domain-containing protein [Candidatus Nanopelagicales bacterium]
MTTSTVPAAAAAGTRVATLRLRRIDPWSAMKTGFVFSIGLGIMYVIAAALLYLFASSAGVFESFNSTFSELTGSDGPLAFTFFGVLTISLVFAVIEVVVTTLLFAVIAMLYNASASVTGGVTVKLAED